jgi:hypothetical protein
LQLFQVNFDLHIRISYRSTGANLFPIFQVIEGLPVMEMKKLHLFFIYILISSFSIEAFAQKLKLTFCYYKSPHIHANLYLMDAAGNPLRAALLNIWSRQAGKGSFRLKFIKALERSENRAYKKYSFSFEGDFSFILHQWNEQYLLKESSLSIFRNNCADDAYFIVEEILQVPIKKKYQCNPLYRLLPTLPGHAFKDIEKALSKVAP